ncbi:MAG: aromatic amino acid lyase [Caldilineaceae bacterium]
MAVEQLVADGRIAYGITTGFYRFKDRFIDPGQVAQLQLNLVRSHAAGVGPELDEATVRAMLLVRANTLALGLSGVRPVVVQTLVDLLNHRIHPCIPSQGSLGASGDLAAGPPGPGAHRRGRRDRGRRAHAGRGRDGARRHHAARASRPRKGWRCSTARL